MATTKPPRSNAAAELGALGGKARAAKLTKAERSEAARLAATARWKDHTPSRKRNTQKRSGKHTWAK